MRSVELFELSSVELSWDFVCVCGATSKKAAANNLLAPAQTIKPKCVIVQQFEWRYNELRFGLFLFVIWKISSFFSLPLRLSFASIVM